MHIIYRAYDIIEAHLVAGILESNGIHAFVNGYYLQGCIGDLSPMDFANVMVADADIAEATPFIEEYVASRKPEAAEDSAGDSVGGSVGNSTDWSSLKPA